MERTVAFATHLLSLWWIAVPAAFGQSLSCFDARGLPVAVVPAEIPDIGQATLYLGRPVILFNALYAQSLPPAVVEFFLYHECGHHALGHTLGAGFPLSNEQAADCWAARKLVGDGQFDDDDIITVQAAIARFGRADWTHLPGPMRAINLRACLPDSRRRDDDAGLAKTTRLSCAVSQREVEEVDEEDIANEIGNTILKSKSTTVIGRVLRKQQDDLQDAMDECKKDLESARRYPKDSDWIGYVKDDRKTIATKRAAIKALKDRLDDLQ